MSRSNPTTPRGVLQRAAKAYVWGTSPSGDEKPLLVPLELVGKPLTRIENRKLGWVLGASTDVRPWVMSSPDPGYRVPVQSRPRLPCPGPVSTPVIVSRSSPDPGYRVSVQSRPRLPCPGPVSTPVTVSRSSPGLAADGTRVVDESHLEARAGL